MDDAVDVQRVGFSQSSVHPAVLLVVLIAGVVILVGGRRRAAVAFLVPSILIPVDQILLIGPAHFPMMRILALFGLARILWSKFSQKHTIFSGGLNGIDKSLIGLTLFAFVNGMLLWRDAAEFIYEMGELYTAFGIYFLLRFLVRDQDDVKALLRALAFIAAAVAAIMVAEQVTGRNPLYALIGGARAGVHTIVNMRDGKYRATGSFDHPILAGTFGGIILPLFIGMGWRYKKERAYALVGALASTVMAFSAGSSTALFGFMGGIVGLCFWPLRRKMRLVRWGVVFTLVSLHIVMKAPVWQLIARVDLTGGSSADHRYQLVNQCIRHFWEWALMGTKYYGYWGFDMWDLSNQYVAIADPSGLAPLLCFVGIIVYGFKYLGRARRRAAVANDRQQQLFVWALGGAMFANVVAYMGISYFDQTVVAWYALLAMIPAVALGVQGKARRHDKDGDTDKDGDKNEDHYGSGASPAPNDALADDGRGHLRVSPAAAALDLSAGWYAGGSAR